MNVAHKTSGTGLSKLLDPHSIVIVGVTPNLFRIGGIPLGSLLAHDFPRDRILLVNPKYPEIQGIPCHPAVDDLPWAADLAVVCVRAEEVVRTLEALDRKGTHAAVVFAAGFGEELTDSAQALQRDLDAFIAKSGMKIAGPNTIGTANVRDRTNASFNTSFAEKLPVGPLALIGQSGNTISMMLVAARDAGLGMSYFVSSGNETAVEFAEYLEHFLADPGTGAVLGYIEQLRDGPRFLRVADRLREADKALFVMKSGDSDKAREATASHTGAMAGNARVYQTAFRQLGVGIGREPTEVLELGLLWSLKRNVRSRRLAIVSLSGAGCAFLSDLYVAHGCEIPTLPEAEQAALRKVIPAYGMVSNPVDLTGNVINDIEHLRTVMNVLTASQAIDTIVIYLMGSVLDMATDILVDIAGRTDKLIVALDAAPDKRNADLRRAGVAVFNDVQRGVTSLARFLDWSERQAGPRWRPARAAAARPAGPARAILENAGGNGYAFLNEAEAKQLVAAAGIPIVAEKVASSAAAAAMAAAGIGFPVAVKVLSRDIAHKTETGGIALNVSDAAEAEAAFTKVTSSAAKARPDARIEGALVQAMVADGVPIILGVTKDPTFGPVMSVGLGGTATELFQDISLRLLPVDRDMAAAMIAELKSVPLLNGFRGAPRADVAALVDAMVKLSDLAMAEQALWAEIEMNPVLVRPEGKGLAVVDALVRLEGKAG
ncbi:MAG: acetate--CoA ligase family protein [Rhizobiaceae bacterium]|nr:acetate--CoA ligase family protein [Rhizobiaceae bacterium]